MKKIFIVVFILACTQGPAKSQPCLPEGITFNTQAQIDNFQANYPGCTEIEGSVTIRESDITSLDGLNVLTSIGGNLLIEYNNALASLEGLDGLTSIGDTLVIQSNNLLTSLTGLEKLTTIGGALRIGGNDQLTSLSGINNLTSIGDRLMISWNISLTSLAGLEGLTTIGGNLQIMFNHQLTSLIGLAGLNIIGGYLDFESNASLASLTGLDNLASIGSGFMIHHNIALTSLTGLENLTSIEGSVNIHFNDALTSLTGLDNIDTVSITELYIYVNPSLSECDVRGICDYLAAPISKVEIAGNAPGCSSREEVEAACKEGADESGTPGCRISICPNPSSSTITIGLPRTSPIEQTFLAIININGQQLIRRQIMQHQTVVDVSGLLQGLYIVRIINDRTVQVRKIIIDR